MTPHDLARPARAPVRWLAPALGMTVLGLAAANVLLLTLTSERSAEPVASDSVGGMIAWVAFGLVGAVLAQRRPGNAIGWLFIAIGAAMVASATAHLYAVYGAVVAPGSLPLAGEARYLHAVHVLGLFSIPVALLLFPTGRPPSRRWWPLLAGMLVCAAAMLIGEIAALRTVAPVDFLSGEPLHRVADMSAPVRAVGSVGYYGSLIGFLLATVATALRVRRARGVERQQLKWFAFAAVINIALIPVAEMGPLGWLASILALTGIPIAVAFAILRYRLYDLDRLVSRVVSYAVVTALLVAVYLALVTAAGLLAPGAQTGPVAVAASTLAAAALFRPARTRVQQAVDRRFDRSRYDAARVVEGYRSHVRDVVDLDAVIDGLIVAAQRSVSPAVAGVWLVSHAGRHGSASNPPVPARSTRG